MIAVPTRNDKVVVRTDASREAMGNYKQLLYIAETPMDTCSLWSTRAFLDVQKKLHAHYRECLARVNFAGHDVLVLGRGVDARANSLF